MRDDDLRSENYLDVAHHPTMHFASAALSELPGGRWVLRGDLTLRGRSRQVEFEVRFGGAVADPFGNARIAFQAFGSITRNDFGLTYELAKEAGREDVRGDVDFNLDIEAIRPL
jgi:polyisoprenoid-binding protein YceI